MSEVTQVPRYDAAFIAAYPTVRSLELLQSIFLSSPLTIHWESINVPLWAGDLSKAPEVDQTVVVGRPRSFRTMEDPMTGNFELSAPLESIALSTILLRYGHEDDYPLRLTFQSFPPGMSQTNKFFIASISDSFAFTPPNLEFQCKLVRLNKDFQGQSSTNSRTTLVG